MKSTGIVRKIDNLGRVVIPKELRRTFDIAEWDPIEIFVDGGNIVLRKYQPGCMFCGSMDNVGRYKDKPICLDCRVNIGAGEE